MLSLSLSLSLSFFRSLSLALSLSLSRPTMVTNNFKMTKLNLQTKSFTTKLQNQVMCSIFSVLI